MRFAKIRYSLKKRIFTLWLCVVVVVAGLISLYAFQYARNSRNSRIIDTQLLCSSYTDRLLCSPVPWQRMPSGLLLYRAELSWIFGILQIKQESVR